MCWINLETVDPSLVKSLLLHAYAAQWNESINEMPKLRLYKHLKMSYGVEDYLKCTTKLQRSVMAKMRFGIFPIEQELGRYRNKPLEDRLCAQCTSSQVENEEHFLCICPKYQQERGLLYYNIMSKFNIDLNNMNNSQQLNVLLNEKRLTRVVCNFIIKCLCIRNPR